MTTTDEHALRPESVADLLGPTPAGAATAVFVDFENAYYALLNDPVALTRDAAIEAALDALESVRARLRAEDSDLLVERAYADWERMPAGVQRRLQISGVLPRYVDARPEKSTADIELSLDALETILGRSDLEQVVVVGGDRDYLPVLRRLKERGLRLSLCAWRATLSRDVRAFLAGDPTARVIELDGLVDFTRYAKRPPTDASDEPLAADAPAKCLEAMLRFMRERGYTEIYLGPFLRWAQTPDACVLLEPAQVRRAIEALVDDGAVHIERRVGVDGIAYAVATVTAEHPRVQRGVAA